MPPGRDLRHHSAVLGMQPELGGHHEDMTTRPLATTAAAVSSQEVSMPKISIFAGSRQGAEAQSKKPWRSWHLG